MVWYTPAVGLMLCDTRSYQCYFSEQEKSCVLFFFFLLGGKEGGEKGSDWGTFFMELIHPCGFMLDGDKNNNI